MLYTNANATLYNYFKDKETGKVMYRKTYLRGIFWDDTKQSNVLKSGMATVESVFICVPFDVETEGKTYKSPKEYQKANDKDKYFTFIANSQDLIVKGIIDYDINNTSMQTISESLSYLRNNYDNVMTISVVDEKDFGNKPMRHWEIGGK